MAPLLDNARDQFHRKPVRYAMVSVVAVATSQVVLIVCSAILDFSPIQSNLAAVSMGCIPSYTLNRSWVWKKRGKNHFWREVFPFWMLALVGLAFSTLLVAIASDWSESTLVVSGANLTAFGILWVVKYLTLDAILFKVGPVDLEHEPVSIV